MPEAFYFRVCPSVSESPGMLVNCNLSQSKNKEGNFIQFWSQMHLGFVDVLIRFWGQKVNGQGRSRRGHNGQVVSKLVHINERRS